MHSHDSQRPPSIQACVFDWAGTLVDFGCHAPVAVFSSAFAAQGIPVREDQVRGPMGMGKRDHIATMLRDPDIASRWAALHGSAPSDADIDHLYATFLPLQVETVRDYATPIAGVQAALSSLRERGIRIGSTTGYPRVVMEALVPAAAAFGIAPDVVVCIDDVPHGRPAPDQVLAALAALGEVSPSHAVVIDDSEAGVEAGRRAGAWTVGVAGSGNLVGLSAEEYAALTDTERARLVERASIVLRAAGAHAIVETVASIEDALEVFGGHLLRNLLPQEVAP